MERLGEIGEFVNTLFTANQDPVLGDRRFALYVITHPDAAGIVIRINAASSSSAPPSGTRRSTCGC